MNFGSPLAMKEAICFLYQGVVQVTYDNVRDLIEVAEYLQISTMKQCCVEYLNTVKLNIENCVQVSNGFKTFYFVRQHIVWKYMSQTELQVTFMNLLAITETRRKCFLMVHVVRKSIG